MGRTSISITLLLLLLLLAPSLEAHEQVPIEGQFQGLFALSLESLIPLIVSLELEATGQVTHLGRAKLALRGDVEIVDGTPIPIPGTGVATLTAANGDEIFGRYLWDGQPSGIPGVFDILGTFTIAGGSGRLAGATGGGDFVGRLNVFTGAAAGSLNGTISSPGASKRSPTP